MATNGIELELHEQGSARWCSCCTGSPRGRARTATSRLRWRRRASRRAPNLRGYAGSDAPAAIDAYDQVTLAADVAGLIEALGEERAVVVGHDWGAVLAWNAALLHPARVRAVVGMSVPWRGRPPMSPLGAMQAFDKGRFFYVLYFQSPGVAEAELGADVRRSLRMLFYSASGDAPPGLGALGHRDGLPPSGLLQTLAEPPALPAWLGAAELDGYVADFTRSGFAGPLNWYRNFDRSWERTAALAGAKTRSPPCSSPAIAIRSCPGPARWRRWRPRSRTCADRS